MGITHLPRQHSAVVAIHFQAIETWSSNSCALPVHPDSRSIDLSRNDVVVLINQFHTAHTLAEKLFELRSNASIMPKLPHLRFSATSIGWHKAKYSDDCNHS